MRMAAVAGVVLFHFDPGFQLAPQGYLGVDIFFTISGFVITSQMLRRRAVGDTSYPAFLKRRVRRLLPSAVFVAVTVFAIIAVTANPTHLVDESHAMIAALLYVANFFFAAEAVDYFGDASRSAYLHYWSLSVEEQFYLVAPLLVAGLAALATRRRITHIRLLGFSAVALGVVSVLGASLAVGIDPDRAFFMPWWRAHELLLGVAVAAALHVKASIVPEGLRSQQIVGALRLLAFGWLVALMVQPWFSVPSPSWQVLLATCPVAILLGTPTAHGDRLDRVGEAAGPAAIAAASYVTYLWHWPVWLGLSAVWSGASGVLLVAAALTVTASLAAATHRWVELPFQRGAALDGASPFRVLAVAGSACVAVSAFAVVAAPRIVDARSVAWASQLNPSLAAAPADLPPAYSDGCFVRFDSAAFPSCFENASGVRSIALMGDSHAAQWQGALIDVARENDARLFTFTRGGCPAWQIRSQWGETAADRCDEWRRRVLQQIREERVNLVVVTMDVRSPVVDSTGLVPADPAVASRILSEGIRQTLEQLVSTGAKVVVLEDTPHATVDPLPCLARADKPSDCSFTSEADGSDRAAVRLAASSVRGVTVVDPYRLVCPGDPCLPVRDGRLLFSDAGHLTNSFVKTLGPWVSEWARPLLPASG